MRVFFCRDAFERINLILFRDGFYVAYGSSRHTMWAAMMPNQPQKQSSIVRNKGITFGSICRITSMQKNNILMQLRERKINRNLKSWYFDDHLMKILYQKRLFGASQALKSLSNHQYSTWLKLGGHEKLKQMLQYRNWVISYVVQLIWGSKCSPACAVKPTHLLN